MYFKKFKFVCIILSGLFIFSLFFDGVNAQTTEDVLAETESAVTKRHIEALKLELPEVTDNPNLTMTFEPLGEDTVIKLQIDGNGYNEIKSPYKFNSLTVDKHVLDFKYNNESDIEQSFSIELVVIPRELRFGGNGTSQKQSFEQEEAVEVLGSAMPNAEVTLWFANEDQVLTKKADVNGDGRWSVQVKEGLECGKYSVWGIVVNDGLASRPSDVITLAYCEDSVSLDNENEDREENKFTFKDWKNRVVSAFEDEQNSLIPIGVGIFLVGAGLGLLYGKLRISQFKGKMRKVFEGKLRGDVETEAESLKAKGESEVDAGESTFKKSDKRFEDTGLTSETEDTEKGTNAEEDTDAKRKSSKGIGKRLGDLGKKIRGDEGTAEGDQPKAKGEEPKAKGSEGDLEAKSRKPKVKEDKEVDTVQSSESSKEEDEKPKEKEKGTDAKKKPKKDSRNKKKDKKVDKKNDSKRDEKKEKKLSREEFIKKFKKLEKENEGKGPTISLTSSNDNEDED